MSSRVYFDGDCLEKCPDGTFFADGSCRVCSNACAKCEGTPTTCTGCLPSQFLIQKQCLNECPGVLVGGICKLECEAGKFLSERMCKDCEDKCSSCLGSAGNCSRCADGLKSLNGDCVERCPADHLDRAGECAPCDQECEGGCTGTIFLCERCRDQLIKVNGRCIEECPDAQFYNSQLQICQPCIRGCDACRSLTQC